MASSKGSTDGGSGGSSSGGNLNLTGEQGWRTESDGYQGYPQSGYIHNMAGYGNNTQGIHRAKAAYGGYGQYGLGGESKFTSIGGYWIGGRSGTAGVVIIYEF